MVPGVASVALQRSHILEDRPVTAGASGPRPRIGRNVSGEEEEQGDGRLLERAGRTGSEGSRFSNPSRLSPSHGKTGITGAGDRDVQPKWYRQAGETFIDTRDSRALPAKACEYEKIKQSTETRNLGRHV